MRRFVDRQSCAKILHEPFLKKISGRAEQVDAQYALHAQRRELNMSFLALDKAVKDKDSCDNQFIIHDPDHGYDCSAIER